MVIGVAVRKYLFVVLSFLLALGVQAGETTFADTSTENTPAAAAYAEALVTIAPVPMPARVIELASFSPRNTSAVQARKIKLAKTQAKSMLSRSARGQLALAKAQSKPDERARLVASDEDDDDTGLDDLDLHRSFSQPKVAKAASDADQADTDLSDYVKLRLFLARTKAIDAYNLSQIGKDSTSETEVLPERVLSRLAQARAKALQAHSERFGSA